MTKILKTIEQIISELGEIPYCQCDAKCGQKVKIKPERYSYYKNHGYPKFIVGHGLNGKKRPEHSEKMKGEKNPMWNNPREDLQEKFKGEGNPMFGKDPWNLGLTKETNGSVKSVSDKLSGVPKSEEHKSKLRIPHPWQCGDNNCMNKPEVKKKSKEIRSSQEFRDRVSIISTEMWKRPGIKEKLSNSLKIVWSNPEYKKRNSGINASAYGRVPPIECSYGIQYYYESPLQGKIRLRSSYEYKYAKYLDQNNILWYYEIETFPLSNEMTYTPDFFLPEYEKFIEIKGWMKPQSKIKIERFLEEYPWNLEILFGKDLKNLGINLREEII